MKETTPLHHKTAGRSAGRDDSKAIAFTNGTILTMDPERPAAATVIIKDGRIAAVGDETLVRTFPGIAIYDLAGRTLIPAFIDSHNHLSSFACFFPQ